VVQLNGAGHDIGKIFPSEGKAFSSNGKDGKEIFVVIVSKKYNEKIVKLFSRGTISNKRWLEYEQRFLAASSLLGQFPLQETIGIGGTILSQKKQEDFEFGGSLRGGDPFWSKLRVSSGMKMISQKFEFNVQE
jgi:hypothetical protein